MPWFKTFSTFPLYYLFVISYTVLTLHTLLKTSIQEFARCVNISQPDSFYISESVYTLWGVTTEYVKSLVAPERERCATSDKLPKVMYTWQHWLQL